MKAQITESGIFNCGVFLNVQSLVPTPHPISISQVGFSVVIFLTVGCEDLIFLENCFEFSSGKSHSSINTHCNLVLAFVLPGEIEHAFRKHLCLSLPIFP